MNISICGFGKTGGALYSYLAPIHGHIAVYDPPKKRMDSISDTEVNFICVPTETKSFKQELFRVESILKLVHPDSVNFVRSNILPGTCDHLMKKHFKLVVALPTFETQKTPLMDLKNNPMIFGGKHSAFESKISYCLGRVFPKKRMRQMMNRECEMAKYANNALDTITNTFYNSIHDLCQREKINYGHVVDGLTMTGTFNKSHSKVPNSDGTKGWGSDKQRDVEAFMGYLSKEGNHPLLKIMEATFCLNRFHRGDKKK